MSTFVKSGTFAKRYEETWNDRNKVIFEFIYFGIVFILPIYALAQPLFGSFKIGAFGDPDIFKQMCMPTVYSENFLPSFDLYTQVWDKTVAILSKTKTCYAISFSGFAGNKTRENPDLKVWEKNVLCKKSREVSLAAFF